MEREKLYAAGDIDYIFADSQQIVGIGSYIPEDALLEIEPHWDMSIFVKGSRLYKYYKDELPRKLEVFLSDILEHFSNIKDFLEWKYDFIIDSYSVRVL